MGNYAVVDLEMCKVPKNRRNDSYHWAYETIQIGAALLDENLDIVDEFMTYVCPQYGYIDNFIKRLTGIKGMDVKDAPTMEKALEQFVKWIPEDAVMVSWSDSDLMQIKHEIEGKNICMERWADLQKNWIDCQKLFTDKLSGEKAYNLTEALLMTDIIFEDGAHDGLVDAHNTALLFRKLKKEPELKLNKYYTSAKEEKNSSLGTSLADLLSKCGIEDMY